MAEVDKTAEPAKQEDKLEILKGLVDELYHFRDHYFETHSVEDARRKTTDVAQEMERTLKELEENEKSVKNKAEFLLLKGKCLNVSPKYSAAAEECLSKAVKLEPGVMEGWNTLGDQYWKKQDMIAAKACFTGALQRSKNKVSLRSLSMLLRQLPADDNDERGKRVLEGVDMARQAVQLDVTDATSWYILGNAYLSLFFSSGQNTQMSQRALNAYAQSEKVDKTAKCNADLHFNRANLFQYEEMFGPALAGYDRAAALDPDWNEPPEREKQLLEYLGKVTELVENKGKVKAGRLRTMLSNLNASGALGAAGSLEPQSLSSLKLGHNAGAAAQGKVVFSLAPAGRVAFTFGMVDGEGTCIAVMVYNTADSWAVMIRDTVVIPEPQVKQHSVTHNDMSFEFRSIRVDSPLLLTVNGKRQEVQSQIAVSVSYKPNDNK